jgi:hypothetical protein
MSPHVESAEVITQRLFATMHRLDPQLSERSPVDHFSPAELECILRWLDQIPKITATKTKQLSGYPGWLAIMGVAGKCRVSRLYSVIHAYRMAKRAGLRPYAHVRRDPIN